VSGQQHAPTALYPRERPGTHCTGGWVGPRAGLDARKISSPPGFDPGPSSPKSVAIPTELPGPPCTMGARSFPGVMSGRGLTLTPHPLLVPWSRKSRAIPLLPLWAVRPVQSLSACTRVHFTSTFLPSVYITQLPAFSTTTLS